MDFEGNLRSGDAQPDGHRLTHGSMLNPLAIDKNSVAAIQIAHPPLAGLENHLRVRAAHIFILDAYFAIFDAPDSKCFQEMEILPVRRCRPNAYA